MIKSPAVSVLILETGVYLLLLFTPLAFGGVEDWALGVFQILCALVFVAWALGEGNPFKMPGGSGGARSWKPDPRIRILWICIGLGILLVLAQLVPLPPGMIRILSPATAELYARTLPGYTEGEGFRNEELPAWLLASQMDGIPEEGRELALEGPPSLPLSEAPYAARFSASRTLSITPSLTWKSLTVLLCLAGVFAAVTGHFRTEKRLGRLLAATLASVALVSFLGMIQKLSWNGKLLWIREGNYKQSFGPFVNRNNFAALAVTVLPLALCLAFRALADHRRVRREAIPLMILNSFAAVLLAGGIFYSLSRGGMLAAVLAVAIVGVMLFYFGRHTTELVLLGILFLAAGAFVIWIGSEDVVERIETLSKGAETPSMALRFTVWETSLDLIQENWLVGTGLGTFRFAFMRYAPPGRHWWNIAHNDYIEILTGTGLLGGVIALTALVAYFTAVLRPGLFLGRSGRFAFTGMVAGLAALLVHSNVTPNLQVPAIGLLAVVLGGALLNHVRLQQARVGSTSTVGVDTPRPELRRKRGSRRPAP